MINNMASAAAAVHNEEFLGWHGVNGSRRQPRAGWAPQAPRSRSQGWRLFPLLAALLISVVLLPGGPAHALTPPWARSDAGAAATSAGVTGPSLQEVAPPQPVQQLQAALARRQPVVEILSPRDDSLLPAGPWTLKLRLHDWPLVDGGTLGPGPHLQVQIDQEPAQIWTQLEGTLPPLSPGSHRLTVYAALPWGEAPKTAGAVQQIRLHRTAANPLTLPAPGTPQLLAVSPTETGADGPLLLDWLLLNAPLQNLRGSGNQWRLRAQINGESVLLDQQTPLWLQGWKSGSNALQLDLLDGRGEPLNPPFNSLVLEVNRSARTPRPRWLGDRLTPLELAVLLGEAPPEPTALPQAQPAPVVPAAAPMPATAVSPIAAAGGPAPFSGAALSPGTAPIAPAPAPGPEAADRAQPMGTGAAAPDPAAAPAEAPIPVQPTTSAADAPVSAPRTIAPSAAAPPTSEPAPPQVSAAAATNTRQTATPPLAQGAPEAREPGSATTKPVTSDPGNPAAAELPAPQTDAPVAAGDRSPGRKPGSGAAPPPASPPQAPANPERIRAGSSLNGRARDLVNADGTLRQPPPQSPVDRMRSLFQR